MMTMADQPECILETAPWYIIVVVKVRALNSRVQIFTLQPDPEKINLFKTHLEKWS